MEESPRPLPTADNQAGLQILKGLLQERSLLAALSLMRKYVGNAFQITLPGFRPAVFTFPEAIRQILVTDRHKLLWRPKSDPVTRLLRRGVLVLDGAEHDELRGQMEPLLQRRNVLPHIPAFWAYTGQVTSAWADGEKRDMLVEMRRIALLILFGTLFEVNFTPDLDRLWRSILDLIEYISPGLWIVWPGMPRRKYRRAIEEMDQYLYGLIHKRRETLENWGSEDRPDDLLSRLILNPHMTDDLIRDQLLTMLIAGHDTSTALLAWTLYLLGSHPEEMEKVQQEVDLVLGDSTEVPDIEQVNRLHYLDQVIKESLRLYPPIHLGNRLASEDVEISGYGVPKDTRLMYSIYLCQRDDNIWENPHNFCPARFERGVESERPPFSYLPFGGGPRNCIGAAFAQVESKVVLARLLHSFDMQLLNSDQIKPYMGATLEPRPGVLMQIRFRSRLNAGIL